MTRVSSSIADPRFLGRSHAPGARRDDTTAQSLRPFASLTCRAAGTYDRPSTPSHWAMGISGTNVETFPYRPDRRHAAPSRGRPIRRAGEGQEQEGQGRRRAGGGNQRPDGRRRHADGRQRGRQHAAAEVGTAPLHQGAGQQDLRALHPDDRSAGIHGVDDGWHLYPRREARRASRPRRRRPPTRRRRRPPPRLRRRSIRSTTASSWMSRRPRPDSRSGSAARSTSSPASDDVFIAVRRKPKDASTPAASLKTGTLKQSVTVPAYDGNELTTSSVIVAEKVDVLTAPLSNDHQAENPYVRPGQADAVAHETSSRRRTT